MTPTPGQIPPRTPSTDEVRHVLAFMPLVAAFFDKARSDMSTEHAESFQRHGLTSRHGAVCVQLVAEEAIGVGQLAKRMGLALSTVSELVGDLDRAGWVQRFPDPSDRRRTLVALSPARRPSMEMFVTRRAVPLLRALDTLTPDQKEGFIAGLQAWAHQVKDWIPKSSI